MLTLLSENRVEKKSVTTFFQKHCNHFPRTNKVDIKGHPFKLLKLSLD